MASSFRVQSLHKVQSLYLPRGPRSCRGRSKLFRGNCHKAVGWRQVKNLQITRGGDRDDKRPAVVFAQLNSITRLDVTQLLQLFEGLGTQMAADKRAALGWQSDRFGKNHACLGPSDCNLHADILGRLAYENQIAN